MKGINIQKIIFTEEEYDRLIKIRDDLDTFFDDFDSAIADNEMHEVYDLTNLLDYFDNARMITDSLVRQIDDNRFIEIEIEGQRKLTFSRAISHFAQNLASIFVQHSRLTFPSSHDIINSTSKEKLIKPNPKPWTVRKEVKVQKG